VSVLFTNLKSVSVLFTNCKLQFSTKSRYSIFEQGKILFGINAFG